MADYMANTNRNMEGEKIHLNSASREDLKRISDIGPDYADRIVDERERRGGFKSVDELDAIEGVGPETVAQIKRSAQLD